MSDLALAQQDPAMRVEVDLTSWSDRKLDKTIVRGSAVAGAHMNGYEEAAAVTGHLLKERRRRLGPRKFAPWLETSFSGGRATAYRYMEMADQVALSVSSLRQIGTRGQLANQSGGTDAWATPQDFFDVLDAEFGFELDVCALDSSAKCERYFTPEDDGLAQDWRGTVWMNPPYGSEIVDWVRKAHESSTTGATVVCLVPARVDTNWWWDHCRAGEIRFLRGRLAFGESTTSAPFPSAVVIFGREPRVVWWEWR